jgi:hypothetical protein
MFATLKTRTAVLMITAITVISAASAPLFSSAAPTIRSVDRTTINRSGTHHSEVADSIWGTVRQSAAQGATNYYDGALSAWPKNYTGVG